MFDNAKGAATDASADENGLYQMLGVTGTYSLTASYIGYKNY